MKSSRRQAARRHAAAGKGAAATAVAAGGWLGLGLGGVALLVYAIGPVQSTVRADSLKFFVFACGLPLAGLLGFWFGRPRVIRFSPWLLAPLAFALWAALSALWAADAYLALREAARWLLISLAAWLALNFTRGGRDALFCMAAVGLGVVAVALTGMAQHFAGLNWFAQSVPPAATFINKNFAAEAVVAGLPALYWLWWRARTPRTLHAWGAALGLGIFFLLLATTRAVWLALSVQGAALLVLAWRRRAGWDGWWTAQRRRSTVVILALPLLLSLLPAGTRDGEPTVFDRAASRISQSALELGAGTRGSLDARLILWRAGAEMAADAPWLGVGAGNFDYWFHGKWHNPDHLRNYDDYAHNEYLQATAELGLPAALLWLALLLVLLRMGARALWLPVAGEDGLGQMAFLGLLGLGVAAVFNFTLHLTAGSLLAGLWFGLFIGGRQGERVFTLWPRAMPAAVLVPFLSMASWLGWRALAAEYWLEIGMNTLAEIQAKGAQVTPARQSQVAALFTRAAASHPYSVHVQANAANGLFLMDKPAPSRDLLTALQARRPYYGTGWLNLARAHHALGEQAEAARAVSQALAVAPLSPEAMAVDVAFLSERGARLEALARARQHATALLAAAGAQAGGEASLFEELARLALQLGEAGQVLSVLQQALDHGYQRIPLLLWRARLLHEGLKDEAGALDAWRRAKSSAGPAAWEKLKKEVPPALLSRL